MPSTLELNCLVLGDDLSHIFTIEIPDSKTVSTLQKAIKDEKFSSLNASNSSMAPVESPRTLFVAELDDTQAMPSLSSPLSTPPQSPSPGVFPMTLGSSSSIHCATASSRSWTPGGQAPVHRLLLGTETR
jgi:hypothetical protein